MGQPIAVRTDFAAVEVRRLARRAKDSDQVRPLMPLPPRSTELNSQDNIWQFMRQNWLSNRVFESYDDIVDHCCYA